MVPLFDFLFSCCLGPKPKTTDSTPLLQDGESPIYVPRDTVSTDRQKVKDHLSNIVRAKEGKMVNINDHLPFNLQNRDFPTPSSSRVRAESPSPHPSVRTAETSTTSHSGGSSRPRGGRSSVPKEPALSVRLVRGREGNSWRFASHGRLGRFGEERSLGVVRNEHINGVIKPPEPTDVPSVRITEPEDCLPEVAPLEGADLANIMLLSEQIGNQLREGWKIKDAGPISRGWGD